MSGHDDYLAGRYGGARTDSASYRWGETLRHVEEANKIARGLMACPIVTSNAVEPSYLDELAASPNAPTRPLEPGIFDAWDARPGLSFTTFVIAVILSLKFIWPALDATGVVPETVLRIVLLGGASLFLSSWTKALPYISSGGVVLILAYPMLLG